VVKVPVPISGEAEAAEGSAVTASASNAEFAMHLLFMGGPFS